MPPPVVEVLSPSTRRLDTVRRRADYGRIGVAELWLVDPDVPELLVARARTDGVLVDSAGVGRDHVLRSPLLPGFSVRLGALAER